MGDLAVELVTSLVSSFGAGNDFSRAIYRIALKFSVFLISIELCNDLQELLFNISCFIKVYLRVFQASSFCFLFKIENAATFAFYASE